MPYIVFYQTWEARRIDTSPSVTIRYEENWNLNVQNFVAEVIPPNSLLNSSNNRKSKNDLEKNKSTEEVKGRTTGNVENIRAEEDNKTLGLMQIKDRYGRFSWSN